MGEVEIARRSVAALEALRECGDGQPTPDQRGALAGWGGWGPLARAFTWADPGSTWGEIGKQVRALTPDEDYGTARDAVDTAFYTPGAVTAAVWGIVTGLGFTGGRVLEPGCGSGRFIAAAPPGLGVEWTGVEADRVSARIAALLHPGARIVHGRLEKTTIRHGGFDLAVGNVPFSSAGPFDPGAPKGLSLHNYFIWRALSAVRPGGLVVLVTSRWTLDAADAGQREELGRLGLFLGAVRVPGKVLAEGGTEAVTDIIAFRRRTPGDGPDADDLWLCPAVTPEGLSTTVSAYFLGRPEMVAGEMRDRAGQRYGMTLDVVAPAGTDGAAAVAAAASRLVQDAVDRGLRWEPGNPGAGDDAEDDEEPAGDLASDGRFTLYPDGTVTRRSGGRPEPVKAGAELVALIRLRDAATALFAAEADQDMSGESRTLIRRGARRLYREYTDVYGFLNRSDLTERADPDGEPGAVTLSRRRPLMGGFRSDPDFVTVLALEIWDDGTMSGVPAPILLRQVNAPAQPKRHAGDPSEALALCLDMTGRVDLTVIARLLGADPDAVPGLLGGLVFEDPAVGEHVTADEYLSGNVRVKLAQAGAAAATDEAFTRNVTALEAVQPEDLGPDEISVQLGTPWIPPVVIEEFAAALLGFRQGTMGRTVTVTFAPLTAAWTVQASTAARRQPAAAAEWGTLRVNAFNLVEDALNGTMPVVWDTVGKDERVKNTAETALAADKIRDLQERFGEWLWEDPDRATEMARLYNDRFNCTRVRQYDGSMLTFPGMTGGFAPYPSQRDMVWRAVCTPAALCAHTVGAGKTSIMVLLALTLRRLGLAAKPAMIVPNHLLEQETAEARRLYPGAKILMVTREDLTRERRRAFAAKIGARDWDLILMTHQQFMSLPVSASVQADYITAQIDEFDEAMRDKAIEGSRTVKQLATRRKKLIARHEELLHAPRDLGVTFEQTGIDYLMVDESHFYKNLELISRADGFSTAGSKRADDLAMKLAWLRDRNRDGRCCALFTGTPLSNSLAELHVLFRYLTPGELGRLGLKSFDAFAAQYIRYATKTEVAPDGSGFRSHRRPDRYCNLPELRSMLGEVADIRTRKDLNLAGPQVRAEHVTVTPQPELAAFTADLVERADKIRQGGVKPQEDNMLAVCGDGRRAALDLRLAGIIPSGPGKIEVAAARIARAYRETRGNLYADPAGETLLHPRGGGLQVVFCDQGTPDGRGDDQVYGRLRGLLAEEGVPVAAVAFIHSAKTHADRAALFARCRSGEIAVLVGSTEKCGTGVNIQQRMTAIHHLDAPWRPADVEQRDGRGDRPGNENSALFVIRYVTERSFDAYMWQALERKARFIGQILTGDPAVREVDDAGSPQLLSYGELKALATGQPLLMELSAVNSEIGRLRNQSAGHKRTQARMRFDWNSELAAAGEQGRYAGELDLIVAAAGRAGDTRVLQASGGGRHEAGDPGALDVIKGALDKAPDRDGWYELGYFRGVSVAFNAVRDKEGHPHLTVRLARQPWAKHPHVLGSQVRAWAENGPAALLAEISAMIDGAEAEAAWRRQQVEAHENRARDIKPYLDQEWPHKKALADALAERARIEREIDAQIPETPAPAAGTTEKQAA